MREHYDTRRIFGNDQISIERDPTRIDMHESFIAFDSKSRHSSSYSVDGYVSGASFVCTIAHRSNGSTARVVSK